MPGVIDGQDQPLAQPTSARVSRATDHRRVAGVCAGLAPVFGVRVGRLRFAFLLGALCGGLGIVVYLASWLIMPAHEDAAGQGGPSGLVIVAWATGGVLLLALLALASAVATVFGLGWAVLTVAAAVLAAPAIARLRLRQLWVLPAVAALTLPSVAIALSPVRLAVQSGASVDRPATSRQFARATYTSGFGTLLVDLRDTRLPASGTIPLRIDAGIKRTIVALPPNRCVRVVVHYDVHPFARQLASLLSGTPAAADYGLFLFGAWHGSFDGSATTGTVRAPGALAGPTLSIDFTSQGGSLYVRNYPDDVSPQAQPYWPGFHVTVEPRPNLRGEPLAARREMLRDWRARRLTEQASADAINPLIPGPCSVQGTSA
jgi:phage shock protein PspC (stress-responsive transcriptional regulator)